MAQIPVEKKSNKSWLWLLLLLLAIALIVWWLVAEMGEPEGIDDQDGVYAEQTLDADAMSGAEMAGTMTVASILASPTDYYGMTGFTGEVDVGGPLTDRGFWIEQDGERMFALIIDQPREVPVDVNDGARLRLSGGTIRNPQDVAAGQIEGVPLDQDTLDVIAEQEAILVVNEANIEIIEAA
ncbi:MAG: hypothetical protein V2I27_14190 [Erythrobacter sp.]|jgi:hypothetical protein|nr:hypothetical protein [Erythrobacter sp.]